MHVRSLLLTLALSVSLTPALVPSTAFAQMGPAPDCKGTMSIVRVSDILPGKMDTFLKAAAGQQAWYKKAGTSDEIFVMRVLKQDPSTKAWRLSAGASGPTGTLSSLAAASIPSRPRRIRSTWSIHTRGCLPRLSPAAPFARPAASAACLLGCE